MAVVLNEPEVNACIAVIEAEAISLIGGFGLEVISVTPTWRSALRMPMQAYILHSSHHDYEPSEDGDGGNAENSDGWIAPLPGGRIAVEYKGKPAGRVIYELKGNAYRPVRGQNERSGC